MKLILSFCHQKKRKYEHRICGYRMWLDQFDIYLTHDSYYILLVLLILLSRYKMVPVKSHNCATGTQLYNKMLTLVQDYRFHIVRDWHHGCGSSWNNWQLCSWSGKFSIFLFLKAEGSSSYSHKSANGLPSDQSSLF
jgi:hypothetical protein